MDERDGWAVSGIFCESPIRLKECPTANKELPTFK
jgi:hypothetical protein